MTHVIRARFGGWTVLCLTALALFACGRGTGEEGVAAPVVEQVRVTAEASFNGEAFSYRMTLLREEALYRVYALSYPSPLTSVVEANNTIPAEYYVPADVAAGGPRRPAVICMHILNGNFELVRLLCTILAEKGVPALFFKLPYYGERSPPEGRGRLLEDVRLFSSCMEQSLLDVRRTIDVLVSRPEVDASHIGISGISLGAIMGASACGVDTRLTRAQLILGGGDLLSILMHSRETRSMRQVLERLQPAERALVEASITRVDPLTYADALRSLARNGHLAMINASEDEVIPRECTMALARTTGMEDKVRWLEGMGHYTAMAALPEIVRDTALFFAQDLPVGVSAPVMSKAAANEPLQVFTGVLQQAVSLLTTPPAEGTCNYIDLAAAVVAGDGRERHYSGSLIVGSRGRFCLRAEPVPEVGSLAIGNGQYPWLRAKDGRVFVGKLGVDTARLPGDYVDPAHKVKLLAAGGAVMAMTMAPGAFRQYIQVEDVAAADGERALGITLSHRSVKGSGTLILRQETLAPQRLLFNAGGMRVTVVFRQWQFGTVSLPELFEEPREGDKQDVTQEDLLRMFASTFNFAMEKLQ